MSNKKMLIFVSSTGNGKLGNDGNNNKYYFVELKEDNTLYCEWGRIGTKTPQHSTKSNCNIKDFNKVIKSKTSKGYVEAKVDLDTQDCKIAIKGNLLEIAMQQINFSDQESKKLIEHLVEQNIHNIISNTNIKFDIDTGYFKTPLGIIKKEAILEAKKVLDELSLFVNSDNLKNIKDLNLISDISIKDKYIKLNEKYFTYVPTKLKNLRDLNLLLHSQQQLDEQYNICDALLSSIDIVEEEKLKQIKKNEFKENKIIEKVFDTTIELLKDKKEIKRIETYFEKSKNTNHGYNVNNVKIKNIYKIKLKNEEIEFKKDMKNIMELWHGTKVANILSIMKSGLLMPKLSPGQVTGYMFGQGLYFSNQSTKSLNYCDGMYWSNNNKQKKIYMFLASVAMGNYLVPSNSTSKNHPKEYDSYWAQGKKSGVLNDEMIVFKNNQIKLEYLLEIEL